MDSRLVFLRPLGLRLLEITLPAQTALKGKKIEITMEEEPRKIKAA